MGESQFARSTEEAFAPGSPIWIAPDLSESSWTQKIDWYLNFQIMRSTTHRPSNPSSELATVISEWEMEKPEIQVSSEAPLMIASAELLPNHAVVVVPVAKRTAKAWADQVYQVWQKLDEPQVRVFLPKSVSVSEFAKAWPESQREFLAQALVAQAD